MTTTQPASNTFQNSPQTSPEDQSTSPIAKTIDGHPLSWEKALEAFIRSLQSKNRSLMTIRAYQTDVSQFIDWLKENLYHPTLDKVERADIIDYLAELRRRNIMGTSRARKTSAVKEFFRYLIFTNVIIKNPAEGVETPKKERNSRTYLRPDEYRAMLGVAGANPMHYCVLQLFLQTGVRVSELCTRVLNCCIPASG